MNTLSRNWVNFEDFAGAARQVRRRPGWVARRFLPGKARRVSEAWSLADCTATHFYECPEVLARRDLLATGAPGLGVAAYLAGEYLPRGGLRGVSIGCGAGAKERQWAATGRFAALRCYDLSSTQIDVARGTQVHPALSFAVADALGLEFDAGSLDVIIFEDSLHHLAPMRMILGRCAQWLERGGYLFVNEYTGPRQFQYSTRQIEAANALLALLPERLRVGYARKTIKRSVNRPSRLRMRLLDPSEAVQSDLIVPTIHELFDLVEERKLGGTLVNLVLDDIAHNFRDEPEWLQLLFSVEDAMIGAGEIESDYTLIVAKSR